MAHPLDLQHVVFFRITSGRSLKSIEQKSEMLDLAKLPVSAGYQEFTCHASKMNQFNFEIESADLILFKLLHSKPYELFNTLRIYLENYDEPYTEYLNYLFFELLGMIPEIKPFEDFRFDKKFISIIIGNLIKDKLVYELRILSEKPVKKVIYINRELIKHIAKIITISNLSGENKFDFKMFNV